MPQQTRQLAAIMFTDIVGYTALMGKDSAKALELVRISKEIQKPLVEKHNGEWLKEMGDGAMAQFSSALDAVNCSLEIQRTSRADLDADIRIGIHLGDITIENNDVYGDGVNVASRLESIADPGGIYISESIEKAIRGQTDVQAKFLGAVKLKNVDYDVRTYAIQGVGLPVPEVKKDNELSGRFFAEIQRRGVIRAGATYVALSLLLILFVPYGASLINLPLWTSNVLITCLIIGFPIALYLAWNYERGPEGFIKTSSKQSWQNPYKSSRRKPLTNSVFVATVLIGSIVLFFYSRVPENPESPGSELKDAKKLHMLFPEDAPIALEDETPRNFRNISIALSPDGKVLAYIGWQNDRTLLYLRYLDQTKVIPVKGTEGAYFPIFSPDSKWVAYLIGGELRKVMVPFGTPQFISKTPGGVRGAVWAGDDNIFFTTNTTLWKISGFGGTYDSLTSRGGDNIISSSASGIDLSPDEKHIIFSDFQGDIYGVSIETGKRQLIYPNGGGAPFFTPSGHLLFSRNKSLFGVAFDLEKLQPLGNENLIISDIRTEITGPQLAFSNNGMAIHIEGDYYQLSNFIWIDNKGKTEVMNLKADSYGSFDLSPDGKMLAVGMLPAQDHIMIHDLEKGRISKILVPSAQILYSPLWGPDNESIIFSANTDGQWFLYKKNIYEVGEPQKIEVDLSNVGIRIWPYSWSESGDFICAGNGIIRLNEDRTKGTVESIIIGTVHAEVSPNSQYVVYSSSTETGQEEVYLQPIPITGKKWQISIDGGTDPIWSKDGKIIYYHDNAAVYSVEIDSSTPNKVNFEMPKLYYKGSFRNMIMRSISVSPDGNRILLLEPVKRGRLAREAVVTLNWFDELKRLAPVGY